MPKNIVKRRCSNFKMNTAICQIFTLVFIFLQQGLFEQVLAMDDYTIFVPMMVQKNIELQQQALMLIIQTTGSLPDSLKEGGTKSTQQPAGAGPVDDEEEIMRKVLA